MEGRDKERERPDFSPRKKISLSGRRSRRGREKMAEGKAKKPPINSALVFSVQINPGLPSECQHNFWVEYVPTHAPVHKTTFN